MCIKDIDISNIGERVHLKVTFSPKKPLNILYNKKKKKAASRLRLSEWVNKQVEPAYKKVLGESGNNRYHKSVEL